MSGGGVAVLVVGMLLPLAIITLPKRYFHIRLASTHGDDDDDEAAEPYRLAPKLCNQLHPSNNSI